MVLRNAGAAWRDESLMEALRLEKSLDRESEMGRKHVHDDPRVAGFGKGWKPGVAKAVEKITVHPSIWRTSSGAFVLGPVLDLIEHTVAVS